jgi:hypothetical protein
MLRGYDLFSELIDEMGGWKPDQECGGLCIKIEMYETVPEEETENE